MELRSNMKILKQLFEYPKYRITKDKYQGLNYFAFVQTSFMGEWKSCYYKSGTRSKVAFRYKTMEEAQAVIDKHFLENKNK